MRVNALSRAFQARSEELEMSQSTHIACAAITNLTVAVSQGQPIKAHVEHLRNELGSDPLIASVLNSLPPSSLSSGVSSERTLLEGWPAIKRAISITASLPPQGGGLISTAVANLAASLKVCFNLLSMLRPVFEPTELTQ